MKALRVLHLEDTESDSALALHALKKGGYDVTLRREYTAAGFLSALESGGWDVILSDHEMGGFTSADAFSIHRRYGSKIPIILLSGRIGEEQAAEAMRQGVYDYVLKDRLARLVPAVERALEDAHRARETERLQQELLERARDLELFVRHAPASIAMLDHQMRYVAVSDRWLSDYRLTGQKVIGRSHYAVFPELPDHWKAIHQRCLAGATERKDEEAFVRADGTVQWIRWEVRPWHASSKRIGGIFIYSEDVTEKVEARDALEQNERMLSLGQAIAHVGTFWRDLSTNKLVGTEEAYRILGPGSKALLDAHDHMGVFIHPDDVAIYWESRETIRRTGKSQAHEFRVVHPDGTVRAIRSIAAMIRDAADRPVSTVRVIQDITEAKAAETEIREKEWMLSRAQEAGQIGTWFWNAGSGQMTLSDQTYRILGIDAASWGHTIEAYRQLIHPEDRDGFELRRMVPRNDLGGRFSDDYRIIRPDGSVRHVNHVGEYSRDDRGKLKGLIGILQDITERKEAEEQLHEKEWMLTRAQEAGNIGTWYLDLRTGARNASAQTWAICGLTEQSGPGRFDGFTTLMEGEERERHAELRRKLIEEGVPLAGDFHIRRPDGELRSVHIIGNRLNDAMGRPIATIGIIQDITERKRIEADLRSSRQLLQSIVDAIPHAISLRNVDGLYVFVNKAWSEWFGIAKENAVGLHIDEIHTRRPEDNAAIIAQDMAAREARAVQTHSRSDMTPGGKMRHSTDIRAPILNQNGQVTGIVGISVDVTKEREAAESLRANQALLTQAQRVAGFGVWIRNHVTGEAKWSDELYMMMGLDPKTFDLSSDAVLQTVHPDDRELVIANRLRVRTQGGRFEEEHRIVRPDGGIRHMRVVGEAVRDSEGRVIATLGVSQDVTERHEAEADLREKEWMLSRAQEIAHVGSWFRDLETDAVRWSGELYRIWGESPETFTPTFDAMLTRIHPEDRDWYAALRKQHIADGTRFTFDHRILWPNGEVRYVHVTGQTLNDTEGKPKALIGITQDVTERFEAERAMKEKDWILTQAQQVAQLGVWYRDVRTGALTWSQELYSILRLDSATVQPSFELFLEMLHPEDRKRLAASRQRMHETPSRFADEYRIVRPGQEMQWVHMVAEAVTGPDGRAQALIAIVRDVTEQRVAEQQLLEQKWMLSRAQEIAHIGTFLRNVHTGDLKWSDEMYRICGVDPASFTPTVDSYANMVHPDDRKMFLENRMRALAENRRITEESRIVRPDGTVRDVILIAEPVRDGTANQWLMGIVQDVTERKVDEGRLVQAQKLEAMGRLTAGVAHDFNNLLTIISGNLELMRRDQPTDGKLGSMLETVLNATQRGADLIRQMSAFNRKRPVKQRMVHPMEVMDNVNRLIPRTLGETIEVSTSCDPGAWPILVDGAQLESALVNMAINARDAMPDGGRLVITVHNQPIDRGADTEEAGDYVMFTIGDNGTGIPPESLDRIFEPFYTTKSQGKGTGLGLSMVFGFVKQSGGFIRVYSEVGLGTTFRLYFPRHQRGAVPEPERRPAAALQLPRVDCGPVLVVEDQAAIRGLAEEIFHRMGLKTLAASDAKEALAHIQREPAISMLFSDVMLPGGTTGIQLVAAALRHRPGLPVLLTSGLIEDTIDLSNVVADNVRFLEKPYQYADIQAKAVELLSRYATHPPEPRNADARNS